MNLTVDPAKKGFTVILHANPSTGYQWSLEHYNKRLFKLEKKFYVPKKTKLIGAGGQTHFYFSLKERKKYPNQSKMRFNYSRPWDKKSSKITIVNINIQQ